MRDALARLRRLGGIDGQFTFETKAGPKTLAFERGTIQSVSGQDVVVRAKDGTTWNWTLVSDSVVRQDGTKATSSALSAGELVFVGGPVVSGSHDARLIVIRNPQKSSSSPQQLRNQRQLAEHAPAPPAKASGAPPTPGRTALPTPRSKSFDRTDRCDSHPPANPGQLSDVHAISSPDPDTRPERQPSP